MLVQHTAHALCQREISREIRRLALPDNVQALETAALGRTKLRAEHQQGNPAEDPVLPALLDHGFAGVGTQMIIEHDQRELSCVTGEEDEGARHIDRGLESNLRTQPFASRAQQMGFI